LDAVREAARATERVRIAYVAASTGERTERTIEPEIVFASAGHWYVAAWDTEVGDERLLRVDRIASLDETGDRFEPRGLQGAGRALYRAGERDVAVRVRLQPSARWVAEYYLSTDTEEHEDGSLTATLPTQQITWVARLFLRLGSGATVLDPPDVRDAVVAQARETLARYEA
jgi:proteasome accessory factor C